MGKCLKLLFISLCTAVLAAVPASAEKFCASDFEGASADNGVVVAEETKTEIIYEWYSEKSGIYTVSFSDAVSEDCTVTVEINESYPVRISDISRPLEFGFEVGINKLSVIAEKNGETSKFSLGTLNIEYSAALTDANVHLEANEDAFTYINTSYYYKENYGSDMSNGDVLLLQTGSLPDVEFAVYAPVGGEYSMKAVLSELGRTYTSDILMTVNGKEYQLTADTMTKLKDMVNANDKGLMKLYSRNGTVTLNKGINAVSFKAIEMRENDPKLYIFFLDCVDFAPVNEIIEVSSGASSAGAYSYAVSAAEDAVYYAEVSLISTLPLHKLPECSVSGDGKKYITLDKNKNIKTVSEYSEDGKLYSTYRLTETIDAEDKLYIKIGNGATVQKISLIPAVNGIKKLSACTDRAVLIPGNTADITLFAVDNSGYALNLDYLRRLGGMTFKTSNRGVLAVDASGKVTALAPGIAYVTVSLYDGTRIISQDIEFNVYNKEYGFMVLSAENDGEYVKVKLLSPFGTKEGSHTMLIAEYADNTLANVKLCEVDGLEKGQIKTYKVPATENTFKIISLTDFGSMKPIYEAVTAREVQ